MGDGIFPDEARIWIGAADIHPSTIATSTTNVTGEISNYSESGGEKNVTSIPVFGGGNLDKEEQRTQYEVSFDIEMQYGANSTRWDEYKHGTTLKGDAEGTAKSIFIEWTDGTYFYSKAYNNAKGVTWNPTSAADGNLKGTFTFKLSPTTTAAVANLQTSTVAASNLPDWS